MYTYCCYLGQKKLRQSRKPNKGACMLERSCACATCAWYRLSQFFLAGVVVVLVKTSIVTERSPEPQKSIHVNQAHHTEPTKKPNSSPSLSFFNYHNFRRRKKAYFWAVREHWCKNFKGVADRSRWCTWSAPALMHRAEHLFAGKDLPNFLDIPRCVDWPIVPRLTRKPKSMLSKQYRLIETIGKCEFGVLLRAIDCQTSEGFTRRLHKLSVREPTIQQYKNPRNVRKRKISARRRDK